MTKTKPTPLEIAEQWDEAWNMTKPVMETIEVISWHDFLANEAVGKDLIRLTRHLLMLRREVKKHMESAKHLATECRKMAHYNADEHDNANQARGEYLAFKSVLDLIEKGEEDE